MFQRSEESPATNGCAATESRWVLVDANDRVAPIQARRRGADFAAAVASADPAESRSRKRITAATSLMGLTRSASRDRHLVWPFRVFEVAGDRERPVKWSGAARLHGVTVVRESPAWTLFGPRGEEVTAIFYQLERITQADRAEADASRALRMLRDGHLNRGLTETEAQDVVTLTDAILANKDAPARLELAESVASQITGRPRTWLQRTTGTGSDIVADALAAAILRDDLDAASHERILGRLSDTLLS